MRIVKDGSVFHIELESSAGRFETRISLAVNGHGEMNRPRLEIDRLALTDLVRQSLQYVQIEDLLGDDNFPLPVRWEATRQIIRLMDAISFLSELHKEVMDGIPGDLRSLFERWGEFHKTPS